MQRSGHTIRKIGSTVFFTALLCAGAVFSVHAQVPVPPDTTTIEGNIPGKLIEITADSTVTSPSDADVKIGGKSKGAGSVTPTPADTVPPTKDNAPVFQPKPKPDFKYHSPAKATWMSAALPGLGQFYNRRYWKPPIIYVGLGVAVYFLVDNQTKFIVARNSLRARLGVAGFQVNGKYQSYAADQIKADRDFYRSNRDYCIIAVAGIYALNIIDAVVDAHLRTFDVGEDLSMKVRPSFQLNTAGNTQTGFAPMPGIAWTLKF